MKTIILSDACTDELLRALTGGPTPPVVVPPVVTPPVVIVPPPLGASTRPWPWAGSAKVTIIDTSVPIAIAFDVPAGGPVAAGGISLVEYPGSSIPTFRVLTLAQKAGDFNNRYPWRQVGVNPVMSFSIGEMFPSWPSLPPGRWYFNIANSDGLGNPISTGPVSNLRVTLTKPQGY